MNSKLTSHLFIPQDSFRKPLINRLRKRDGLELRENQTNKTQPPNFAYALNSMMDDLENVVVSFEKTLSVMLEEKKKHKEKTEKLESFKKPCTGKPVFYSRREWLRSLAKLLLKRMTRASALLSSRGPIAIGKFSKPSWHKEEKENLFKKLDIQTKSVNLDMRKCLILP